jgi:tRNA pseudouridine38-40 synthase
MRNLKLTISYDGTDYVGWQIQHNGIAVQQRLEEAWEKITGEHIRITASGRTDAGVHALAQVCSLKTNSDLPPNRVLRALNAETPYDMAVTHVEEAPEDFHAIRDAVEKTYVYFIQFGRIQDPLRLRTCWFIPGELNVEAMVEAAKPITGVHDFASFESKGAERATTVRDVKRLLVTREDVHGFPGIKIEITANGFLYNMVRNIVGSLIEVGKERKTTAWMVEVREAKDRVRAGQTAPAHALFLDHVVYEPFDV